MASVSSARPYGAREIRSLYPAITENRLRYLERWGLVRQVSGALDDAHYSFADLTTIKQVASELERGVALRMVLRGLIAERQGQLALDFHAAADTRRPKVITLEARRPRDPQASATALPSPSEATRALGADYFAEASHLDDGDPRTREAAASAYRKALAIDPDLVPGLVNLANIHYAKDEMIEAQALYERAISLEPHCFEAHFNLGNIHHDLGRFEPALSCYRTAVDLSPTYPDAHFYLAVTLEKTGQSAQAKPHWRAYQELAPEGEWSELVKEFTE